jgi:hypothetical protein
MWGDRRRGGASGLGFAIGERSLWENGGTIKKSDRERNLNHAEKPRRPKECELKNENQRGR